MEHIVQFGITIDDNAIQNEIIRQAAKRVADKVDSITHRGYDGDSVLSKMAKTEIKKLIEDNKEEIINRAVKDLSANLTRTKAVREAVQKVVGE